MQRDDPALCMHAPAADPHGTTTVTQCLHGLAHACMQLGDEVVYLRHGHQLYLEASQV